MITNANKKTMMHLLRTSLFLLIFSVAFAFGDCGSDCKDACSSKSDDASAAMGKMNHKDLMKMTKKESLVYYTCPMESHSALSSDKEGKCEECNMPLVKAVVTDKKSAEFYGCPMESHSHIRSDKAGKCEECGMKLKPMRLAK